MKQSMAFKIVCIGEPLAEITQAHSGFNVAFGGDTLNTAIYCARSATNDNTEVHYVSVVGNDLLSQGAVDLLESEGVQTKHVTRDAARQIGIYAIQNDIKGERSFHYWRENSAARQMFSHDTATHLAAIKECDLVYLSGISIAVLSQAGRDVLWHTLAKARTRGVRVAFDSNYRPKLWDTVDVARLEIARFWQITDIALPSHDDEQALFGDPDPQAIAKRLRDVGAQLGAVKCGHNGPLSLIETEPHGTYHLAKKNCGYHWRWR